MEDWSGKEVGLVSLNLNKKVLCKFVNFLKLFSFLKINKRTPKYAEFQSMPGEVESLRLPHFVGQHTLRSPKVNLLSIEWFQKEEWAGKIQRKVPNLIQVATCPRSGVGWLVWSGCRNPEKMCKKSN